MHFSSYVFIFLFAPLTIGLFFLIAHRSRRLAAGWLLLASLFFYGWWNPVYVPLLLLSITFNYVIGAALANSGRRALLAFSIAANLALLGYYKYAGLLAGALDDAFGAGVGEWSPDTKEQ